MAYRYTWKKQQAKRKQLALRARQYLANSGMGYSQARPYDRRPLEEAGSDLVLDCSALSERVYRDCGVPLYSVNGYGNTWTQRAMGVRVSIPAKGDLAFYESPDHVGVIVEAHWRLGKFLGFGGVMVVEHGSSGGPRLRKVGYRQVVEIRRYILRGGKDS